MFLLYAVSIYPYKDSFLIRISSLGIWQFHWSTLRHFWKLSNVLNKFYIRKKKRTTKNDCIMTRIKILVKICQYYYPLMCANIPFAYKGSKRKNISMLYFQCCSCKLMPVLPYGIIRVTRSFSQLDLISTLVSGFGP